MLEAFTGFETENKYEVYLTGPDCVRGATQQPYFIAKEHSECCERQCCGSARSFNMTIEAPDGQSVLLLQRPFTCTSWRYVSVSCSLVFQPSAHDDRGCQQQQDRHRPEPLRVLRRQVHHSGPQRQPHAEHSRRLLPVGQVLHVSCGSLQRDHLRHHEPGDRQHRLHQEGVVGSGKGTRRRMEMVSRSSPTLIRSACPSLRTLRSTRRFCFWEPCSSLISCSSRTTIVETVMILSS